MGYDYQLILKINKIKLNNADEIIDIICSVLKEVTFDLNIIELKYIKMEIKNKLPIVFKIETDDLTCKNIATIIVRNFMQDCNDDIEEMVIAYELENQLFDSNDNKVIGSEVIVFESKNFEIKFISSKKVTILIEKNEYLKINKNEIIFK